MASSKEAQRRSAQNQKARYKALGVCRYCPRPRFEGKSLCELHLIKRRLASKDEWARRRDRKKSLGKCIHCNEPGFAMTHGAQYLYCEEHREKLNARTREWNNSHYEPTGNKPGWRGNGGYSREGIQRTRYPFIRSVDLQVEGMDLLIEINSLIPLVLPPQVREEVGQDLAVAILDGTLSMGEVKTSVPNFIKEVYRRYPTKYGMLSLDQPIPGQEDELLRDLY